MNFGLFFWQLMFKNEINFIYGVVATLLFCAPTYGIMRAVYANTQTSDLPPLNDIILGAFILSLFVSIYIVLVTKEIRNKVDNEKDFVKAALLIYAYPFFVIVIMISCLNSCG